MRMSELIGEIEFLINKYGDNTTLLRVINLLKEEADNNAKEVK